MQLDRIIRWVVTLFVLVLAILVLGVVLYLTESFFAVWDRLLAAPRWLLIVYCSLVVLFLVATLWIIWRLIVPSRRPKLGRREEQPSEEGIAQRIDAAVEAGVAVEPVVAELNTLEHRRAGGQVYISFFGEISSGKSSLINALLNDPASDEKPIIDVRGGSTRRVQEFSSNHFPDWIFADVPGLDEASGSLDQMATEEARRSHVVVYVCDADLTRADYQQIEFLATREKPMLLALNKSDQLNPEHLQQVVNKIKQRLAQIREQHKIKTAIDVVAVSAASTETIVQINAHGEEQQVERVVEPNVEALEHAISRLLKGRENQMSALRDDAVFALAADKLDVAEEDYRLTQSRKMVQSYTKKAVVGAMAAIAPGTDLLIQGVLATALVKEMCALYQAPVKDLDVQKFLKEAQKHIGKAVPVILAVAGNVFKAFPGIGTVAGGMAHAVAYGLAFDALGKSLAITLADGRGFNSKHTTEVFRESLKNDLETRTKRIAKLALALRKDTNRH